MDTIDIVAIERYARRLRAQEIQRMESLLAEYARTYALLLGRRFLSLPKRVSETLRSLFSWDPHRGHSC